MRSANASPERLAEGHNYESTPHGLFRRLLRWLIHFFSYHLILSRRKTRIVKAAGFRLKVPATVFHPRYFLSSERFADFIDTLQLSGKTVVDVGTGSGILALAAARAGAERVIALDINPNAAVVAVENARANGLGERIVAAGMNLLSGFQSGPMFDVVLSNLPKHAREPRDLADRGWHAGPNYRDIAALFSQARERLRQGGRIYVMLSSDSDPRLFGSLFKEAGLRAKIAGEYSIMIESFIIYELDHDFQDRP
jgi:methylase of polypeptide subunit release factors